MTCRAVLFDLGYTLLDYPLEGTWREYLRARLQEMYPVLCQAAAGPQMEPAEFAQTAAQIISGHHAREIKSGGRSWPFLDRLVDATEAVGLRCEREVLDRITDSFLDSVRARAAPYPDTQETLSRLRAGRLKLAVISNSPWDTPGRLGRADLERCGIASYFDATVFSGDVPWRKPNPEFMWEAARRLAIEPSECLVVGDSLRADIAGARAAGMRCAWVKRDDAQVSDDDPQPDEIVPSLSQLSLLERL